MPLLRRTSFILGLATFAACAGVSPRPEAASAESLPAVELSAEQSKRLAEVVGECVRTVVLRRFDQAEQFAHSALAIDPRCARAHAVLGMVMLQRASASEPPDLFLTNGGDAETLLAEQIAPQDAFVGFVRALFLAESGHISAAAAAADAALARTVGASDIERAPLFGVAGTYHYELGEEHAAAPLLRSYLAMRPDDATANFRLGSCLLRMAAVPMGPKGLENAQVDAESAVASFSRCYELAPGDDDAALAIGTAMMRVAEVAAQRGNNAVRDKWRGNAAAQFGKIAGVFPGNAEAMFRLGVASETLGDKNAAREAYTHALERDAEHLGSLLNLAALLDDGTSKEPVKELIRRALAVDAKHHGLTATERKRLVARTQGS